MFSKMRITQSMNDYSNEITKLKDVLSSSDCVIVGAGAGLSSSAGFTYSGNRFEKYFFDFIKTYDFHDMYSGGFLSAEMQPEIMWAYWSRFIYINRYMNPPKPVYDDLYNLIKDKDYFVITTNVDHCFQKANFDKNRLFYTQGDYGLFQCTVPCHKETYDNEEIIKEMLLSQGFTIAEDGTLTIPENTEIKMEIPTKLIPHCPVCGEPMQANLRGDDTFVENEGWQQAANRYTEFLKTHETTKTLFLELGVGYNTPIIIKYPFWQMTNKWPDATYACVNFKEASAPEEIKDKSILINGDIGEVIKCLQ